MLNIARSQSVSTAVAGHVVGARSAGASVAQAALGTKPKTSDHGDGERKAQTFRNVSRLRNEALRHEAAKILRRYDIPGAGSVTCCGTKGRGDGARITLRLDKSNNRASFGGLMVCSNVWACPVCARRIASKRRDEANAGLSEARKQGLSVYLVTLTFRHDAKTDLKASLSALTKARARLVQRREWRALEVVGTIGATEVTHGRNGFHPHVHSIVLLKGDPAEKLKALKKLSGVWLRCLQAFGLDGGKAAFDVRDGSAAGDYIAKSWQAGEELALGVEKTGKAGGRTPEQLLADASDGDTRAAVLWAEYARAFHGKRQLVWSRGLKARLKVGEVSDDEISEGSDASAAEIVVVRTFTATEWELVRGRKTAMLRAAERGASVLAAMFGPSDLDRWRRFNGDRWER